MIVQSPLQKKKLNLGSALVHVCMEKLVRCLGNMVNTKLLIIAISNKKTPPPPSTIVLHLFIINVVIRHTRTHTNVRGHGGNGTGYHLHLMPVHGVGTPKRRSAKQ